MIGLHSDVFVNMKKGIGGQQLVGRATLDDDGVASTRVIKRELKIASGLSAPHRMRDLVDVQELIGILDLPLLLANQLDESVRAEYQRLWGLITRTMAPRNGRRRAFNGLLLSGRWHLWTRVRFTVSANP